MRKSCSHIAFCPDHYTEIENYELALADNFVGWICHHRNGEEFSKEWLVKNNMYYNRTDPHEFKFVTIREHAKIHGLKGADNPFYGKQRIGVENPFYGKHHTAETKEKMKTSQAKRKRNPLSAETKAKIAASMRGKKHSEETKRKMCESQRKRLGGYN